jgi:hypothetical protein
MNYSRIRAAAALASCILLPSIVQAQNANGGLGNSGYGIFGNGNNLAGIYSGSANNNNFSRNFTYNPSQIGNYTQGAYTGSYVQPLGLYGLGANGNGNNLNLNLNLGRFGSGSINSYAGLRQFNQNSVNGDWATNYKQAERLGEEHERTLLGNGDDNFQNLIPWALGYKEAMFEGEKKARIRAGEEGEPEFRDWATSYKDQELKGEATAEKDRSKSKQRAATLRQARELKDLEAELSADPNKQVAQPSLALGLQGYHGPGYPSQIKSYTHFYPNGTGNSFSGNRR